MDKIVLAFDFDGTIIDSARESFLASAKAYEEMTGEKIINPHNEDQYVKGRGFSINAEANFTLIKLIAENKNLDFSKYSQKQFDEEKIKNTKNSKEFVSLFLKHREQERGTEAWFKTQPVFQNVKHTLENLSKKYPLYIVTTKELLSVISLLDYYKIKIGKDHVLSDSSKGTKEDLLKALVIKEQTNPSKIILFDDAIKQLIVAKQMGFQTVLVMWGEKREVFISEAKKLNTPIIYTPKKCLSLIKQIEKKVKQY